MRRSPAVHDTIAFAEGMKGRLNDGYSITYAYRTFSSCNKHPNLRITAGGYTSTAAGRYQYLYMTRAGVQRATGLPSFEPENQEKASRGEARQRSGASPRATLGGCR